MARKRARLTLRKRRTRQEETSFETVDTTVYEVEKIIGNSIKKNTIFYELKWLRYSDDDNTKEPEYRLNCDNALMSFVQSKLIQKEYIDLIPDTVEKIEEKKNNKQYILDVVDPLTSIAQTTVLGGSVKMVNIDTVSSKLKYLKYLISNNQSYVLNSVYIPPDKEIRQSMDQYQRELDQLQMLFPDYPKIKITKPHQIGKMFYSPPPLTNLLFEPVTEKVLEDRKESFNFIPGSSEIGFNKVKPFVDPSYFQNFDREVPKFVSERSDFYTDPRFKTSMKLIQSNARGWSLHLEDDTDENIPLMLMTGVIRPRSAAQKCLETEGETVAFSSFIEINGTDMCLDRRELHDFSKYIPHSCEPTCSVRLVDSGHSIPDLVVYSLQPIDSLDSHAVTLNYFKMFQDDINQKFKNKSTKANIFSLYDESMDFVQCLCDATNCSGILHLTKKTDEIKKPPKKKAKNSEVEEQDSFGGLKLAESSTVYTIKNGKFDQ